MIDVTVYALWGLDENGNGVADVLENKALLVFRVVNGTWADGSHGDKTVVVLLEDGKGTLSNADVPTGMKPIKTIQTATGIRRRTQLLVQSVETTLIHIFMT